MTWRAGTPGEVQVVGARRIRPSAFLQVKDPALLARLPKEACGKVFHAPAGKACPIFACCAKKGCGLCGECGDMPCGVWRDTRDPSMSDEAFEASIRERAGRMRF